MSVICDGLLDEMMRPDISSDLDKSLIESCLRLPNGLLILEAFCDSCCGLDEARGAVKKGRLRKCHDDNQYAIAIRTHAVIAPAVAACGDETTGSGQSEF
jgi:hypothetical protein